MPPGTDHNEPAARWRAHAICAAVYLAIALWALRAMLPAPTTTLPYAAALDLAAPTSTESAQFEKDDQLFHVAIVAHHARSLLGGKWTLFDSEHCYPFPSALTLGEHMLGAGLLALGPYAVSGEPVLAFNVVSVLALLLPALTMYALVYYWTGGVGSAFVAGLLFAFHPDRIFSPGHPFIHGNQWTPLALLFAARLFERRTWLDAAGLALAIALQLLESPYQVIAFVLLGGVYGAYLAIRNRDAMRTLAGKLAAIALSTGVVVLAVFGPYLHTRATWPGLLGARDAEYPLALHAPADFLFGGSAYPGTIALLLAVVAVVDRFVRGERRRHGHDPRLVLLAGGLFVAWVVMWEIRIPLLDVAVPSPLRLARDILPGVEAVRLPAMARLGAYLVVAFLAGYGAAVLVEKLRRPARAAITLAISAVALAEVFVPQVAERAFGRSVEMTTHSLAISDEERELYRALPPGAVLDYPLGRRMGIHFFFPEGAQDVYRQAVHHQPVAACFASFPSPLHSQMASLASRLPDRDAVEALAALGFETVVLHPQRMRKAAAHEFLAKRQDDLSALTLIGTTRDMVAYRLASTPTPISSFAALARTEPDAEVLRASPSQALLPFAFANRESVVFRHPDPLEPSDLIVRYSSPKGLPAGEFRTRGMLPVALGAKSSIRVEILVPAPEHEGRYVVTLARADQPDEILANHVVEVGKPPLERGLPEDQSSPSDDRT